jgi:phage tail tape-measure protein
MGYSEWSGVGSGALAGAGAGATIGSVVPVIGTGVGALAGGLIGGLGGYWSGKESNKRNATSEKYAALESGNSRQQTLIELMKEKRKQQWQLQFGDALRNAMLNRGGA